MATHCSILPGTSYGQRSVAGYSPRSRKRVRHVSATQQQVAKLAIIDKVRGFFTGVSINKDFTNLLGNDLSCNQEKAILIHLSRKSAC